MNKTINYKHNSISGYEVSDDGIKIIFRKVTPNYKRVLSVQVFKNWNELESISMTNQKDWIKVR